MAAPSELPREQDLLPGEHPPGAISERSGAFGQQKARHPEQVVVPEQAGERGALRREQARGAVPVAGDHEVGVVQDGPRQRE
jgi:hypothetical protein